MWRHELGATYVRRGWCRKKEADGAYQAEDTTRIMPELEAGGGGKGRWGYERRRGMIDIKPRSVYTGP